MHITDFGISKLRNNNTSNDNSGTPGYMGISLCIIIAPEVMCGSQHGIGVDYFALGVIAYECMMRKVQL